jgi:hypothetical protein
MIRKLKKRIVTVFIRNAESQIFELPPKFGEQLHETRAFVRITDIDLKTTWIPLIHINAIEEEMIFEDEK